MTVIDNYLNGIEKPQRLELEKIRKIIKQIVPDTEEVISYGIPTLKYKDKNLIHFAAFKDHMSLFPGAKPIDMLKDKLSGYKIARGTIQFTLSKPIPKSLIVELVNIRLIEIKKIAKN